MIFTSSFSVLNHAHEEKVYTLYIEWALSIGVAMMANKKALL